LNNFNLTKIAFKSIQKNKLRTFLTMLGIIIGVASVITMLAIGQGSKASIQKNISSMGSNLINIHPSWGNTRSGARTDRSASQSLSVEDVESLVKDNPYLEAVSPVVSARGGQAIFRTGNSPTSMQGVAENYLPIRTLEIGTGSMFTAADIKNAAKVAVIGKTVVENLFTDGSDPLGQTIRYNKIPFKVIGVLKEKGENTFGQDQDDVILAPYTTVQKRIMAVTYINQIVASAKSEETVEQAIASAEEILRKNHKITNPEDDDFRIMSQKEILTSLSSTSAMMTILLASIAGISLFVGGIGIMNIMFVSVIERTKEIGLRLAIGAREIDIMLQFLIESIIISLTGGLAGFLLGISAAWAVNYFLSWPVLITSGSIIISLAVCSLTGIFFGWYPAYKASKLDPITALRYE
jgi:putative ABC transport system permease protein